MPILYESWEMTDDEKEKIRTLNEIERNTPIKPMLAIAFKDAKEYFTKTTTTKSKIANRDCLISRKIDGIRCVVKYGNSFSRSGKPIKNKYITEKLKEMPNEYIFDGELTTGEISKKATFASLTEGIMKIKGEPNFTYHLFDIVDENIPHEERHSLLLSLKDSLPEYCKIVEKTKVSTLENIEKIASSYIEEGYEGAMINLCNGIYKFGRATKTNPVLVKYKEFIDDEAIIVGYEELETNLNELFEDELGFAKRSTSKDGKIKAGALGSFICERNGIRFKCGSGIGLTKQLRIDLWINRESLIGKYIKFKHFEIGADLAPRMPIFLGFRDKDDMDKI